MWLSGLDATAHDHGIGAPETIAVLRHVDGEIKRIEDGLKAAGLFDSYNIWVTSDHGFSTHTGGIDLASGARSRFAAASRRLAAHRHGRRRDLRARRRRGGGRHDCDRAAEDAGRRSDLHARGATGIVRRTGAGHAVVRRDPVESRPVGADPVLAGLDGCGECARRARLGVVRRDRRARQLEPLGRPQHADCRRTRSEARRRRVDVPSANVDFAPTFLTLLGLAIPSSMQGRPLDEAWPAGRRSRRTRSERPSTRRKRTDGTYAVTGTFSTVTARRSRVSLLRWHAGDEEVAHEDNLGWGAHRRAAHRAHRRRASAGGLLRNMDAGAVRARRRSGDGIDAADAVGAGRHGQRLGTGDHHYPGRVDPHGDYTYFHPRDIQPPFTFKYSLDGSATTNTVNMGRGPQEQIVEDVVAGGLARHHHDASLRQSGERRSDDERHPQVLSLESPTVLVIETTRAACSAAVPRRRGPGLQQESGRPQEVRRPMIALGLSRARRLRSFCRWCPRRVRRRARLARTLGAAQHRADVPRQPRHRRGRHLRRQSRCADAAARRPGAEGMRLTNFNTEYFCTPSRAAILTGRHSVRSGTNGNHPTWGGLTQWEITLAELLALPRLRPGALRQVASRRPRGALSDRSGIRGVVRHSALEQRSAGEHDRRHAVHLGGPGRRAVAQGQGVRPDDEANAGSGGDRDEASPSWNATHATRQPFFLFLPLTQVHFPTLPHPDFAGKTGRGRRRRRDGGDGSQRRRRSSTRSNGSASTGNTIVIWTTDGGAEFRRPWRGTAGPVARVLHDRDGGRTADAVHDPLARADSRGPGLGRDRPRGGRVHDARACRRRRRTHGSRDRRRRSDGVLPGRPGEIESRGLPGVHGHAGARGEVARVEAALRVAGRADAARANRS